MVVMIFFFPAVANLCASSRHAFFHALGYIICYFICAIISIIPIIHVFEFLRVTKTHIIL